MAATYTFLVRGQGHAQGHIRISCYAFTVMGLESHSHTLLHRAPQPAAVTLPTQLRSPLPKLLHGGETGKDAGDSAGGCDVCIPGLTTSGLNYCFLGSFKS